MHSARLFQPLTLRSVTFRNRIGVSPMCQYSAVDGWPNDWHMVHLGSRAVGGAGLVMAEATAVEDIGRISPADAGIWKDDHVEPWRKITRFISEHGAVPGIQLAHAGWKGSTAPPWEGHNAIETKDGGWQPVGVTDQPFHDGYPIPRALTLAEIESLCAKWGDAARRAVEAGFKIFEIHAAHGYLLHSFYSPISNHRSDEYGGSFENRTRLLQHIVRELRSIIPEELPLMVRLSCSDWIDGGWTIEDSVRLGAHLRDLGVDIIDCSSGGISPKAKIDIGPGYQTGFAEAIRKSSRIATAAVGIVTDAHQAETILRTGQADFILLARELLRDPYWPRRAAKDLGANVEEFAPQQYRRAW